MLGIKLLLYPLVADHRQVRRVGQHLDPHRLQRRQPFRAHVFNLHRDDIQTAAPGNDRLGVVEVALHEMMRNARAGALRVRVQHLDAHVQIQRRLNRHTAELTATEKSDAHVRPKSQCILCAFCHAAKIPV